MRIIAGDFKTRRLHVPQGLSTRPTGDRVRESIFSRLEHLYSGLHDLRVFDGFAGSGALGLEALSRGAESAIFCEVEPHALKAIQQNIDEFGLQSSAMLLATDVFSATKQVALFGPVDIVFLDPPYAVSAQEVEKLLKALADDKAVAPSGTIVYEHSSTVIPVWPEGFVEAGSKQYGQTSVSWADFEGAE